METGTEVSNTNQENYVDEIADVAYTYWETRGRVDGHDVQDWLMAEQEVLRRHALRPAQSEEGHGLSISNAA
jgi:hypothetical protein